MEFPRPAANSDVDHREAMTLKDFLRAWQDNPDTKGKHFSVELWNAAVEACAERSAGFLDRMTWSSLEENNESPLLTELPESILSLKTSAEELKK